MHHCADGDSGDSGDRFPRISLKITLYCMRIHVVIKLQISRGANGTGLRCLRCLRPRNDHCMHVETGHPDVFHHGLHREESLPCPPNLRHGRVAGRLGRPMRAGPPVAKRPCAAMVESIGREMHLPRGVPSSPGQPGYDAWRASRERLLHHQLDMLAEEARERGVRGSRT